jgi:hypothetical protein
MVHLHSPTGGQGHEAMVVVMNPMVEALSGDIAAAIRRLASRAVARE